MKRTILLSALLLSTSITQAETLNIYNWSDYLPERVTDLFTRESGITINYITYESNEEMYDHVKASNGKYDLVVPSTYYVSKMQKEGLLQPIDRARLKNFKNLDERLLNLRHDPTGEFSIPYLWGTTSLFIDSAQFTSRMPTAWADLWRPEFKGKLLLTDDMREVFHVGLRALGYSGNSTNPAEIEAAYKKLLALRPNIVEYNSDEPREAITEGRAVAGMMWNGEAHLAKQDRFTVNYIYPSEGAILWIDNLVIPKNAKNQTAAHKFIDFLLKPAMAAIVSESIGYATPNKQALKLIDPWVRGSNTVYPDDQTLAMTELQVDVGDALPIYQKYWAKLRGE
jgi:spermidine/putrescine transport system substrate-binding protein